MALPPGDEEGLAIRIVAIASEETEPGGDGDETHAAQVKRPRNRWHGEEEEVTAEEEESFEGQKALPLEDDEGLVIRIVVTASEQAEEYPPVWAPSNADISAEDTAEHSANIPSGDRAAAVYAGNSIDAASEAASAMDVLRTFKPNFEQAAVGGIDQQPQPVMMGPRINDERCFGISVEAAFYDKEDTENLDKSAGRGRKRRFMSPAERFRRTGVKEAKRIRRFLATFDGEGAEVSLSTAATEQVIVDILTGDNLEDVYLLAEEA